MRDRPIQPCTYLLASRRNGTLYCGSTGDLIKRVWEHRNAAGSAFTARYRVFSLVWFETHGDMAGAIQREYRIKVWQRAWKIDLIERENPTWRDLYQDLF